MTGISEVKPGFMMLERTTSIVEVATAPTKPWRNGNGRTTDLYAHAPSDRTGPSWTLTLADLNTSADFSTFAGYDRHFMIAGPNPVELTIDGNRRPVGYTEVARFSGDAVVRVAIDDGPSRAVNLMVRQSDHTGDLTFRRIDDERVVDPRRVSALVLLSGVLHVDGRTLSSCGDTVVVGASPIIVAGDAAVVARIRVQRRDNESGA